MPHLAETRKEIFQENGDRMRREIKNTSIRGDSRRGKTAQKARGGNIAKVVHSGSTHQKKQVDPQKTERIPHQESEMDPHHDQI